MRLRGLAAQRRVIWSPDNVIIVVMSDARDTYTRSSSQSSSESKRAFESNQCVDICTASWKNRELDSRRASAPSPSTEDYYRCDETLSPIKAVSSREIKPESFDFPCPLSQLMNELSSSNIDDTSECSSDDSGATPGKYLPEYSSDDEMCTHRTQLRASRLKEPSHGPYWQNEAMFSVERRALWLGSRSVLPSEHEVFQALNKLELALRKNRNVESSFNTGLAAGEPRIEKKP